MCQGGRGFFEGEQEAVILSVMHSGYAYDSGFRSVIYEPVVDCMAVVYSDAG
jgi:hypothetical protein